ncbi:MAG: CusA/CzcA family heavy metal efflux RND transporter [Planctomycetota bacterium]
MFSGILKFSITRRTMMVALLALFFIAGFAAFKLLNIEAYPDPTAPMVEVITQLDGLSAEEIERRITIPVETGMAGMPHLKHIRSISIYGLSDVKLQFDYETTYYAAEQQVLNRIAQLGPLTPGAVPSLSPDSVLGEIFRYQLVGPPGVSLTELKEVEDWVCQKRWLQVPGVIGVTSWGGLSKQYEVEVDLEKLIAYHIALSQVLQVLSNANINAGGRTLDIGEQQANVKGMGLIESVADIDNTVITSVNNIPIFIKDVAQSKIGYLPRLGIAGRDDNPDVVNGTVLMRRGEKTLEVLGNIEKAVEKMNSSGELAHGIRIVPTYNRRELINVTTHTVLHNLVLGIILVFFIQWIFLGNLRTAIVVSATVPIALFASIMLIYLRGDSANLLSLGSIDFGIIVDATVIMVENIFRRLADRHKLLRTGLPAESRLQTILTSGSEVTKSIFFSTCVTVAAFLPLFTMQGVEGQLFAPMAKTYGYALCGALFATFTVTPALSALILPESVNERDSLIMRLIRPLAQKLMAPAIRFRALTLSGVAGLLVLTVFWLPRLGMEFLPHLDEGNLWIRANLDVTASLAAGEPLNAKMRKIIKSYPEVETVITQHGRPDDGTDVTGAFNLEFFAPLKPREDWPKGTTKETLIANMKGQLEQEFPGVVFNFSQYIQDNVEEYSSGVKGQNTVKIYGNDLHVLEAKADEVRAQLETVRGIEDVGVFRELGQPNLEIKVDRDRCARHGLATGDVNAIVQAAIAGQSANYDVVEGERHFPLSVRLLPKYRENIAAIREILVPTNAGALVPLKELCDIREEVGACYVYREENARYIPIKFSVRGRDLGGAVAEAQAKVAKAVKLPSGYYLNWMGEFGELQEAVERLKIIVPVAILLIIFLLYSAFGFILEVLIVLSSIPFSWVGGVLALFGTGTPFSVSAAVGFISLMGVAVMDGILVMTNYHHQIGLGCTRYESIMKARDLRVRPVLMTCMSACLGLLPAALSTGIGSETQRPLALVIVGGMLLTPVLVMLVVPVLISFLPAKRATEEVQLTVPGAEPLQA